MRAVRFPWQTSGRPGYTAGVRPGVLFRLLCGMALAVLTAGPGGAHDLRHGDLHVGHAWARPAAAGSVAEVYFPIVNRGGREDRLTGIRTSVAAKAGLAETQDEAVKRLDAIALPSGRPVALRPGRLHVRLEGLARELKSGDQFTVTLVFATASPADVTVIVEGAAGH